MTEGLTSLTGMKLYQDFFAEDLYRELILHAASQEERKIEYSIDHGSTEIFPEPLDRAHDHAREVVQNTLNTIITKIYREGEMSDAFEYHQDPREYSGALVLCTLGGLALISVADVGIRKIIKIRSGPNTALVLPGPSPHKVKNISKTRHFMFMGHKCPALLADSNSAEISRNIAYHRPALDPFFDF